MSKYNYHLTGQNSDFAKIMAKITHYQPHSDLSSVIAPRTASQAKFIYEGNTLGAKV